MIQKNLNQVVNPRVPDSKLPATDVADDAPKIDYAPALDDGHHAEEIPPLAALTPPYDQAPVPQQMGDSGPQAERDQGESLKSKPEPRKRGESPQVGELKERLLQFLAQRDDHATSLFVEVALNRVAQSETRLLTQSLLAIGLLRGLGNTLSEQKEIVADALPVMRKVLSDYQKNEGRKRSSAKQVAASDQSSVTRDESEHPVPERSGGKNADVDVMEGRQGAGNAPQQVPIDTTEFRVHLPQRPVRAEIAETAKAIAKSGKSVPRRVSPDFLRALDTKLIDLAVSDHVKQNIVDAFSRSHKPPTVLGLLSRTVVGLQHVDRIDLVGQQQIRSALGDLFPGLESLFDTVDTLHLSMDGLKKIRAICNDTTPRLFRLSKLKPEDLAKAQVSKSDIAKILKALSRVGATE